MLKACWWWREKESPAVLREAWYSPTLSRYEAASLPTLGREGTRRVKDKVERETREWKRKERGGK